MFSEFWNLSLPCASASLHHPDQGPSNTGSQDHWFFFITVCSLAGWPRVMKMTLESFLKFWLFLLSAFLT